MRGWLAVPCGRVHQAARSQGYVQGGGGVCELPHVPTKPVALPCCVSSASGCRASHSHAHGKGGTGRHYREVISNAQATCACLTVPESRAPLLFKLSINFRVSNFQVSIVIGSCRSLGLSSCRSVLSGTRRTEQPAGS